MRESEAVAAMRRELGRQLAVHRTRAGYLQRELGKTAGYSRSTIANAETGGSRVGRQVWEHLDRALDTGELFTRGYDRIQAQKTAEAHRSTRPDLLELPASHPHQGGGLESLTVSQARQAYAARGWPVKEGADGRLWLVTGTAVDALEVPRPAGLVAMAWWLYTLGVPDEIRGLPALPDPATALAVITAGPSCYFLARSGACPWTGHDTGTPHASSSVGPAVVRWHADGGRVPVPPSHAGSGEHARWAHLPGADGRLASPLALLHVLAQSAAANDGAGLTLPGGVRAVPAAVPAP